MRLPNGQPGALIPNDGITVARSSDRFDLSRREDVDALRLPTRRSSPRNSLHPHDCRYQPRLHAIDLTTRVMVPASNRSNSQEHSRCNLKYIANMDEVHKWGSSNRTSGETAKWQNNLRKTHPKLWRLLQYIGGENMRRLT